MQLKRDDTEHPIPEEMRPIFVRIAEAFAKEDYSLRNHAINAVTLADENTPAFIAGCIEAYGDKLVGLHAATWKRSCYVDSGDHWSALVDLATAQEEVSDLTLHARIYLDPELRIIVDSVHTP